MAVAVDEKNADRVVQGWKADQGTRDGCGSPPAC